jgi:glutathione S-transferase
MTDLILHHYAGSPYAEKIRAILGFKGLAWHSVDIPVIPPRPFLAPLTGAHRRTPVLQVGADVYCDTRRIARLLEARAPEPTLFPPGSRGLAEAVDGWVASRAFVFTAPVRFRSVEDAGSLVDAGAVAAFAADRAPFMAGALDTTRLGELLPAAWDQVRAHLAFLDATLADAGPYLAGSRPSLADFSAYLAPWWLARPPRRDEALDPFPRVAAWMERIVALGHGRPIPMAPEAALEIARTSAPATPAHVDAGDPAARGVGDVTVAADDYGRDRVVGEIVVSTRDEIAVHRRDPRAGDVVQHFPKLGFEVLPAPAAAVTAGSDVAAGTQ